MSQNGNSKENNNKTTSKNNSENNIGKKKINKERTPKQKTKAILKWVLIVILAGALITAIVGGAFAFSWISQAPKLDLAKFEYIEPTQILDKNGDFYQELQGKEKREIVTIDQIPEIVQNAFISIEDERFYSHSGVDVQGLFRAGFEVIRTGSLSGPGGSTITQQLIKLTHLTPEKALQRKVVEMYLAVQLENKFTKKQILESYLNKINFAYAWGVQSASKVYFHKDVKDLSVAQAAVLASIIKSPTNYKPYIIVEESDGTFSIKKSEDGKVVYNEKNQTRSLAVVKKMYQLGHINKEEYTLATEQLKNNDFGLLAPPAPEIYSFFTDALYDQVVEDLMANGSLGFESKEDAQNYLLNSGLVIHSTIDPEVQKVLDEKFKNDSLFPKQSTAAKNASAAASKETGEEINYTPEGAMVIIDNSNGQVAGMIGGRDKQNSRSLNRATQKFQVGSSTKPLTVYAPGLESKKITLASTYDDQPIKIGSWTPGNAGESSYAGMTTIRKGLTQSKNVIAVQAWYDVGLETSVKYGELLGLDFVKEGSVNDMNPAALSLGGYTNGQTALAMSSAYSTFANEGVRDEPLMYTKIEDKKGNLILENKQENTRVFSAETAFLITDVLKNVVKGGTTTISLSGMQIAGKTGTTNDQMHAWFCGYSPYYTAAVWYGYDQNKVVAGGKTYILNIGIYGGSKPGPALMWQEVMKEIHQGLDSKNLPSQPSGIVTASVDSVSGLLPTALTAKDPRGSTVISEKFISGTVPTAADNFHVEVKVDVSTGKIASDFCPPSLVQSSVRVAKPEDRFPGNVKPLNAGYVPGPEKGVLAPNLTDVCTVHTASSVKGIEIFNSSGAAVNSISLKMGETMTLTVKGVTGSGNFVDLNKGASLTSSGNNVSVVYTGYNGVFAVTGLSSGTSTLSASLTYQYTVTTGTTSEVKSYTFNDQVNANISGGNPGNGN
ncbi:MAG: hypothetical protein HGA49_09870 [Eubacteriaceae bacterium]|nr:hypothetical protein [Eubacteriaceae bacterium]